MHFKNWSICIPIIRQTNIHPNWHCGNHEKTSWQKQFKIILLKNLWTPEISNLLFQKYVQHWYSLVLTIDGPYSAPTSTTSKTNTTPLTTMHHSDSTTSSIATTSYHPIVATIHHLSYFHRHPSPFHHCPCNSASHPTNHTNRITQGSSN